MKGTFSKVPRAGACAFLTCAVKFQPGDLVYLVRGLERQTVCLDCAKSRWGFTPESQVPSSKSQAREHQSIGFDSTRSILNRLREKTNANDPKLKQLGGDQ